MNARLPDDLATQVRNASARLGVQPNVIVRAAVRHFVDRVSEQEAVAESDPQALQELSRKRAASEARKALSA